MDLPFCRRPGSALAAAAWFVVAGLPVAAQISVETSNHAVTAVINLPGVPANTNIPSGKIPLACINLWHNDQLLDCFLKDSSNSKIAKAIFWEFEGRPASPSWPDWSVAAKSDLRQAFHDTIAWYDGGMNAYPGALAPDPPPSLTARYFMAGDTTHQPEIDAQSAWTIYKGHVALNLAAEIYGWVPWSLHNYDEDTLDDFFRPHMYLCQNPDGYCLDGGATPANATYVFRFLKVNHLIGATRRDTIGLVLEWCRKNLVHFYDTGGWNNANEVWQYWGYPPISRIIEGTVDVDPQVAGFAFQHWTRACGGTTAFLHWVLKVANIPSEHTGAAGHSMPVFPGEKLYLSHGDDPYTAEAKANYPAALLLIDEATFNSWFRNIDYSRAEHNVGRRASELALQYPGSDWITSRYCDDVKNQRSHSASRVYNETFKFYFSLTKVEASGIWTKLANTVTCPH